METLNLCSLINHMTLFTSNIQSRPPISCRGTPVTYCKKSQSELDPHAAITHNAIVCFSRNTFSNAVIDSVLYSGRVSADGVVFLTARTK